MNDENISTIDKAIQAALARKAARNGVSSEVASFESPVSMKAPKLMKRSKYDDDVEKNAKKEKAMAEKLAFRAERDAQRAVKKAERDAEREVKRNAKSLEKVEKMNKVPHMSKVERFAETLPKLDEKTQRICNEITGSCSNAQVTAISVHLQYFNRVKATQCAATRKVNVDDLVRIVGGDHRFINMVGRVVKSQRIRCYVEVPGVKKPVYVFTSDVEPATFVQEVSPQVEEVVEEETETTETFVPDEEYSDEDLVRVDD